MIDPRAFCNLLSDLGLEYFAGVPDSLLKNLCGYLEEEKEKTDFHITANEGNALSMGIGYHLATGKKPVCFLQNSGLGNLINPLTSLAHSKVYSIPAVIIIGWRGEPKAFKSTSLNYEEYFERMFHNHDLGIKQTINAIAIPTTSGAGPASPGCTCCVAPTAVPPATCLHH